MPFYRIEKKMTATLTVECADEEEARTWADRIVATLEDEDGNPIPLEAVEDFEADYSPKEDVAIELLDEDGVNKITQSIR